MAVVIVTTDSNHIYIPMTSLMTNHTNTLSVHIDKKSSFTLHYVIWPFACLISLIITVWLFVFISTTLTRHRRRRHLKNEHQQFASVYMTRDSTIAGGYEASTIISPTDV